MKTDNIFVRTANLAIATSIVESLIIVFVQYIFPLGFDQRLILDGLIWPS